MEELNNLLILNHNEMVKNSPPGLSFGQMMDYSNSRIHRENYVFPRFLTSQNKSGAINLLISGPLIK